MSCTPDNTRSSSVATQTASRFALKSTSPISQGSSLQKPHLTAASRASTHSPLGLPMFLSLWPLWRILMEGS